MDQNKQRIATRITDTIRDLCIDPLPDEYSDELNYYISMHNISIYQLFNQSMIYALLDYLIDKKIIDEGEMVTYIDKAMNVNSAQVESVKSNKEKITELIEYEMEQNDQLKDFVQYFLKKRGETTNI